MLVLTRRSGESILVGNDITVEVQKVARNRVRLVIQAPPEVRILRNEIAAREKSPHETEPAEAAGRPVDMVVTG